MASEAPSYVAWSDFEQLRLAREIILEEAQAVRQTADRLTTDFCRAVELVCECSGSILVSGMGKAGIVGQKISATLASTGSRSHFLHPAEAIHGDLGRVRGDDVLLIFTQSGETEEVVRLLPAFRRWRTPIVAVTRSASSTVGRAATVVLELGKLREACPLGLAPSASTTAMLALGDALALVAMRRKNFQREDFAKYHPGGSLGRQLSRVADHMRPLERCRVAPASLSVREVLVQLHRPGRRSGAVMLTAEDGSLAGVFTDSDLARLLERNRDAALDRPVGEVMTSAPATVEVERNLLEAVAVLRDRRISELPVVDARNRPVGMLDVTDLLDLMPSETN